MPQILSVMSLPSRSEYSGASVSTWSTGGKRPSLVLCMVGSTPSVPSSRHQNFHIGTSLRTLPLALTVIVLGSSSRFQTLFTQGPTPTTTVSQAILPWLVLSAMTAPEFEPNSKLCTSTPDRMRTPSASALAASPCMLALLLA